MTFATHYNVGTVTVTAASANVIGVNTFWTGNVAVGDILWVNGASCRIGAVNSNTSLTLARPWPSATAAGAYYEAWAVLDAVGYQKKTESLLTTLSSGHLEAVAAIPGGLGLGKVPRGVSPTTMEWMTVSDAAKAVLDDADYAAMRATIGAFATSGGAISGGINIAGLLQTAYEVRFTRTTDDVYLSIDPTADAAGKRLIITKFGGGGLSAGVKVDGPLQSVGHFSVSATGLYDYGIGGVSGATLYAAGRLSIGSPNSFPAVTASRIGTDGGLFDFRKGSTFVGSISVTGTATTYGTGSDHRLKSDVVPLVEFELTPDQFGSLDNALLRVMAMRPVSFRWISAPDDGLQTGFLAHELQQTAPHAVTGLKDAVHDIGTATMPARVIPAHTEPGQIITVIDPDTDAPIQMMTPAQDIPEQIIPAEITHDVRESEIEGADWEKTGVEPAYQTVDHGKITPDIVAALQSLALLVLEQREAIAALEARVDQLAAGAA